MTRDKRPSKVLRGVVSTLMGLTLMVTLLAGAGTSCVALAAEEHEGMEALVPYKSLYLAFVIVGVATAIIGTGVLVQLVRGRPRAYRNALIVLLIGAVSAGIQMAVSQALRGGSAPVNMRFYITLFTLGIFLLLRLPSIWGKVDFDRPAGRSGTASAGTALCVAGIVTLTTRLWVGTSHVTSSGENWVDVFRLPLQLGGWGMVLAGTSLLLVALVLARREDVAAASAATLPG